MPVHRGNIGEVVLNAWEDARCTPVEPDDRKNPNWQRSRNWVGSLGKQFVGHYPRERYRVFWSRNRDNREAFGLNKLLFDLAVCSVSTTDSLQRQPRPLSFIARCHWQIESEFNLRNTRDLVVDMSKLVMGAADHKLFVASRRDVREGDILEQCAPIAACCGGEVYFCFVSHPDDWTPERQRPPALHEWVAGGCRARPPHSGCRGCRRGRRAGRNAPARRSRARWP